MPELRIDDLPPTVNHCYKKAGKGKGLYMTPDAKNFKEYTAWLAMEACNKNKWKIWVKEDFLKLNIKFEFKNKKFPDPNNLLKVLIDALQGIIFINDKWVTVNLDAEVSGKNQTIIKWGEELET